jgi:thymidylate synthase (FAD)
MCLILNGVNQMETKRPTSEYLEGILYGEFPILDHGSLVVIDYMGNEQSIVDAARISYNVNAQERSAAEDRSLLRYLMRNRHCYHKNMEVLTIEGWKRWKNCEPVETFLIPDPITRSLKKEILAVKRFKIDENVFTYSNNRMSYTVTSKHRMWFKNKYQDEFNITNIDDMSQWGHFDPLAGYCLADAKIDKTLDKWFELLGFYLGDGSYASTNRITFHLIKPRKIDYLYSLCAHLGFEIYITHSKTHEEGKVFSVTTPQEFFDKWIVTENRSKTKAFPLENLDALSIPQLRGLWKGLVESDGSYSSERPQIQFSSTSIKLIRLFEALSAILGIDAHRLIKFNDVHRSTAYYGERTTLESRKDYHGQKHYNGWTYCATSSTGLLMVRGAKDKFAFVCGNSTPFEMAQIKFRVKMPFFVARQWVRHRMASINEQSARYSMLDQEFYVPAMADIQPQSTTNKQGRAGELTYIQKGIIRQILFEDAEQAYAHYQVLLNQPVKLDMIKANSLAAMMLQKDKNYLGVAKELARVGLSLNFYTSFIWNIDLHNLLHFLSLRAEAHAQKEIRVYAEKMWEIVQGWLPNVAEAFDDYHPSRNAVLLSGPEWQHIKQMLFGQQVTHVAPVGSNIVLPIINNLEQLLIADKRISKREVDELLQRLRSN